MRGERRDGERVAPLRASTVRRGAGTGLNFPIAQNLDAGKVARRTIRTNVTDGERVNATPVLGNGKYDVSRAINGSALRALPSAA